MITNQNNNKEKENFNAFIDMMAQLIQKYGQSVLNDTVTETEEENEQRR
ncbi:MAG: hypothetical protein K2K80_00500 [Clostridia bacterium]|nr:hypothetical protein [Clostridia bacterium]